MAIMDKYVVIKFSHLFEKQKLGIESPLLTNLLTLRTRLESLPTKGNYNFIVVDNN